MTPGQRRFFWVCVFAMTFVFWYEAAGMPLVWRGTIVERMEPGALRAHFWQHLSYGGLFLFFGTGLTLALRKKDVPKPYHALDWAGLAAGLGILGGVLWHSWMVVR